MSIDKNLPNYLTVARIVIIPIIVLTFYFEDAKFAHRVGALLFIFASITDFFDGYLARKFHLISSFGKMFDPIADKLLVGCVIVMLVKKGRAGEIPCLLILAREFVVAGLREFLAQVRISVPVSRLAKIKTFVQMFALSILILGSRGSGIECLDTLGQISLWVAALLTVITGFSYLKACSKYF
ncbi:CDP-diacylglycerol--glycerol-3-phosphate 3-phosphatidyltransferase [Candidatus Trichorickettsia mobilis]|jgi:cardiolipin synthase|uniref:CDP-diacylglycerol--glycerol-3-phosphate 3-phosphatidyltransferase n=1 Tax=Candidatus Trichorickettsia mobilis TaxID=1346319 RepID=UPI00292DBF40|nr:CDP-diacylglycerol--glycerol-3-phosphate 3-phosphatidyltransferase [Candidatus Trichorickettsia mobilis]